jgi:hypothetical protein
MAFDARKSEERYDALPGNRFPRRGWWRRLRARTVPWCCVAGCWQRSHVSTTGRRGNVCPVHLWKAIVRITEEP